MSVASLPCHYLSLHALISAHMAPWDTYNDGNAEQKPGASGTGPGASGGGDSHFNKEGMSTQPCWTFRCKTSERKSELARNINTHVNTHKPLPPPPIPLAASLHPHVAKNHAP